MLFMLRRPETDLRVRRLSSATASSRVPTINHDPLSVEETFTRSDTTVCRVAHSLTLP